MKQAILFDLDGTLWNALTPICDAYNEAMKKNKEPYRFDMKTIKSYMGLTPEETCRIAFPDKTLEEGLKLFNICYQQELIHLSTNPGTLYPNVKEVLSELKEHYHLYIVSNADKGYIENFIKACSMHNFFEGFVQAGDTNLPKWQNIVYLKNKENIDELVYVGDTLKDKLETQKAGEIFIHAAYGFGTIEDEGYYIDSFSELPSLVNKIFNECFN